MIGINLIKKDNVNSNRTSGDFDSHLFDNIVF